MLDNYFKHLFLDGPVVLFACKNKLNWPIIEISKNIEKLTDLSSSEIEKNNYLFSEILYSEDINLFEYDTIKAKINDNKIFKCHPFRIKGKGCSILYVQSFIKKLIIKEEECILGYIVDVSKQVDAEQNLREANIILSRNYSKIESAKRSIEKADKLKSSFLTNMSHEIRTPMNGIIGFAEILKNEKLDENEKDNYLRIILKSGNSLLNILNNIVDYSRIKAGTIEMSKNSFNLNSLIEELYTTYSTRIKNISNKNLHIETIINEDIDKLNIISDRYRLKQILANLLDNAIKFSPKGIIKFGYKIKSDSLFFFVVDNGIGIPKEKVKEVCNSFMQASTGNTRPYGGIGMGLSLSKASIELMGGNIKIYSKQNKGTIVSFVIPFETNKKK